MKQCPKCGSISLDSENSCGVCGASLSNASSKKLEQLVHAQPKTRPKRKLHRGLLAVIIVGMTLTGTGASFLVLLNTVETFFMLGIILLFTGLVAMLAILGGAGGPIEKRRGAMKREITRGEEQVRQGREERKRRTGEED